MDTNGILSVVENGLIHYRQLIKHRDDFFHKDAIHVTLQDVDLWEKFSAVTNEMIVTKSGRRMFPVVRCAIEGLQEHDMYSIDIEFVQIGSHRWKYMNGDWVAGGKAEPHPSHCVYTHPESPNFGSHWMKEAVSFSKVKLTNKPNPQEGQVVLNSLHKYEPRVHIVKVAHQNMQRKVLTYRFPETQFIAVTAYQNEEVTQLKIRFNPFAKAFQDVRERPQEMVSHQTKHYQLPTSGPFLSLDSNCHNIHHDFGSTTFKNGPTNASNEYCDRYSGIRSRRGCPYSSSHHGSIVKRSPSSYRE
ncbi:T-related protein-like isoform X1 [Leptotrombidium deliense]|uniref:T-related protein-like isoform X1 n=1 Tax=Leptotrombidium deliense TaxID=299467 RepID=A0A443SD54_9ACAR|nr:T-related protein-like isoform X1 [Leptotrombidium deliense]